jgi:ribonuclease T
MTSRREVFISIDVEMSGPIPGEYSLLSIGACDVDDATRFFSVELQPINKNADPKALEVSGFSLEELAKTETPPKKAMAAFAGWIQSFVKETDTPVFVGFNAPFDWSFINYYFHKYLGMNPFGFSALDATGCSWRETRSSALDTELKPAHKSDHNALHDAQYQAELFRLIRTKITSGRK